MREHNSACSLPTTDQWPGIAPFPERGAQKLFMRASHFHSRRLYHSLFPGKQCLHPALHNPEVKIDNVDLNKKNHSRTKMWATGGTFLNLIWRITMGLGSFGLVMTEFTAMDLLTRWYYVGINDPLSSLNPRITYGTRGSWWLMGMVP
jgi:hypothetical protein